jgi:hypothetical protein
MGMSVGGQVQGGGGLPIGVGLSTHYKIEAFRLRRGGKLLKRLTGWNKPWMRYKLWEEEFDNIVVNVGLDDALDKHLKGAAYTAAWYVGLTDGTPTVAAGDTMASHAGWVEVTAYDEAVRQTLTLGAVSGQSVDNSASKAVFTISANGTVIGGAFVNTVNTKGGSTGTLYGAGAFTAGDKTLDDNDVLNVTVTCTAAAS